MKEFAGFPSLSNAVHEVEASHLLVSDLGIYSDHLGMIKRGNEAEIVPGCGHVDVGTWLVRFGLKRKLVAITSRNVVFAEIVHGFAQTLHCFVGPATGIGFCSLTPAPQDKDPGA